MCRGCTKSCDLGGLSRYILYIQIVFKTQEIIKFVIKPNSKTTTTTRIKHNNFNKIINRVQQRKMT